MTEQEQRKKQRLSLDDDDGALASSGGGGGSVAATPSHAANEGSMQPSSRFGSSTRLVLVWDLDETLLVFNSLLIGTFATATQQLGAADELVEVGRRWEAAILTLCDSHFFFDQLEEWDQCCLTDIQCHDDGASLAGYDFGGDGFPPPGQPLLPRSPEQHASAVRPTPALGGQTPRLAGAAACRNRSTVGKEWLASSFGAPVCTNLDAAALAKLAYRYRRIAKLCSFGLQALGTAEQRKEWEALHQETDALTGGWLSHASTLLAACSSQLAGGGGGGSEGREVTHVAVTSGQLVPSLAKLLLFKLNGHIATEHVWSSRRCGKQACFDLVRNRFGPDCSYVAIGDGMEEDKAAAGIGWPFVRVLLASAENYPAVRVLSWRAEAATGGPGLLFTQLTVGHIAAAAGLPVRQPLAGSLEAAHGSSAAAAALAVPVAMAVGQRG